jgi:hypothetical protein
MPDTLNLVG